MEISVVIPVYKEGEPLRILCERLVAALSELVTSFEVILVDDRSPDHSWLVMKDIASGNPRVRIARLARNFGQHSALTAGLSLATGRYIVMMDCDQQDSPEDIPALYHKIRNSEAKIVFARRKNRKDSGFKRWTSQLFNNMLELLSGIRFDSEIGTFRIMEKFVAETYLSMPEKNRFIGGMFFWLNFHSDYLDVEHRKRFAGTSNYNLRRLLKLARLGILSSSTKLLSMGIYLGLISSVTSVGFGLYFIGMKLLFNVPFGYSSIIVSVFFVGSIIMLILGIIGEYLREIFEEVKGRPNYIIEESINF
jgi:glycosyltransferase involved in cell wall biosynthesis